MTRTPSQRVSGPARKKRNSADSEKTNISERQQRLRDILAMLWYVSVEAEMLGLSTATISLKTAMEELADISGTSAKAH
jgi:hypothetical protein